MKSSPRPLFACVAENNDEWFTKAYNLVLSIRRLGGSLADAPIVIHFVEGVTRQFEMALTDLGAEVRVVPPYESRYRFSNKMRMFQVLEEKRFDVLVAIDCDVVVVGDLGPYLDSEVLGVVPASKDHLTPGQWREIYEMFELAEPQADCVMRVTGQTTYPYFNTGVMMIPRKLGGELIDAWTKVLEGFDRVHERYPNVLHENQIAFAVAAHTARVPLRELPVNINYSTPVPVARTFAHEVRPPFVIHYHTGIDERGFIKASRNRRVNRSIDSFNRMRAEDLRLDYKRLGRVPLAKRLQRSAEMRKWYEARTWKRIRRSALMNAVKKVGAGEARRT